MELSGESPPSAGHPISGGQPEDLGGAEVIMPCKCELVNQIRHYNHKSKEFYYHSVVPVQNGTEDDPTGNVSEPISHSPLHFDPYQKQVIGPYEARYQHFQNNEVSRPSRKKGEKKTSLSGFQSQLCPSVCGLVHFLA